MSHISVLEFLKFGEIFETRKKAKKQATFLMQAQTETIGTRSVNPLSIETARLKTRRALKDMLSFPTPPIPTIKKCTLAYHSRQNVLPKYSLWSIWPKLSFLRFTCCNLIRVGLTPPPPIQYVIEYICNGQKWIKGVAKGQTHSRWPQFHQVKIPGVFFGLQNLCHYHAHWYYPQDYNYICNGVCCKNIIPLLAVPQRLLQQVKRL